MHFFKHLSINNHGCKGLIKVQPFKLYAAVTQPLEVASAWLPQVALRSLLAWEFLESGLEKYHGVNWFSDLNFPFPFSLVPVDLSWSMATYFEIIGALALLIGLATRFFTMSLMILTLVAIITVHWPESFNSIADLFKGYRIIDEEGDGLGNYKLPAMYLVMFLPLLFGGAGKLSLDFWLSSRVFR